MPSDAVQLLVFLMELSTVAMMSRPVAGICKQTVILTLPGSPKGAKENLEAVLKLLPHACLQAAGHDSRALHAGGIKKLEQDARVGHDDAKNARDHSHAHPHDHHAHHAHGHAIPRPHTRPEERPSPQSNDSSAGPTSRHRSSPYPMLSVADAVRQILNATPISQEVLASVDLRLVGHVLAEDVTAAEPVPAFRASIVDGYAVAIGEGSAGNRKGVFPVVGVSHAVASNSEDGSVLQDDQIARITTGAPLPRGAKAVVMVEDTVIRQKTSDQREEEQVEVLTDALQPGENVREIGSDIQQGEVILRAGAKLGPGELGLLASVGRGKVSVYEKPVVGVLSTGNELVEHDRSGPLQQGEVRDCNRLTIMATVRSWGYDVVDLGISTDTWVMCPIEHKRGIANAVDPSPEALEESLRAGLRRAHTIITSGGVSMGELDLLKPTLERALGGTLLFGRVAMKPGKPTTVVRVPFKTESGVRRERLVFALPGNPASAMVTAGLFVLPSLQRASGELRRRNTQQPPNNDSVAGLDDWTSWGYPRACAVLDSDVKCDQVREEYQRAKVCILPDVGQLHVSVVKGSQRSSRVGSFRGANALLVLPAGQGTLRKGGKAEVLIMGEVG